MKKIIITIGRQFGSGGREIGKRVAQELGIGYYDKELLAVAAEESGLSLEYLEEKDEKRATHFLHSLTIGYPYSVWGSGELPVEQLAVQAQRNAVLSVAEKGSCVIVGRCADVILADRDDVVSIFISADMEQRVRHVKERDGVAEGEAREKIRRMDKARTSYYNFYSDQKWGAAANYDLCVNASRLGVEGTVKFILEYIKSLG